MTLHYSVFGLSLQSNLPICWLEPDRTIARGSSAFSDIKLTLGASPDVAKGIPSHSNLKYASPCLNQAGDPIMRMWEVANGALLYVAYDDGTEFWFDRGGTQLWATWPEPASLERVSLYLLGPIIGLLLRYRGIICLHASAVAIGDQATIFVGPEETGKSTTAAALTSRGCSLLSEDIVRLSKKGEEFLVYPGYPHVRLWPDSVGMLFGPARELPQFVPEFQKRLLSLDDRGSGFCDHPVSLGTIYILGDRCGDASAPYLEEIEHRAALMNLVANSYASNLLDSEGRAEEFMFLGSLVDRFPVRRIRPHQDRNRLNQLCDVIVDDLQLRSPRPALC